MAARIVKIVWSIGGEAPDRDERHEDDRGQRRERQQAARDAVGRSGPAGRPGSSRSRSRRPLGDRVADRRLALEERRRPATRNGRSSGRRRWSMYIASAARTQEQTDRDGEPAGQLRRRPGDRRQAARWGPPGDPVLRSDPPSTLVQEPHPGDWPRLRRDRARHTSAVAGDRDAGSRRRGPRGPRARSRPPPHHRIRSCPGSGFDVDRGRVPVLGGRPRRRTGRGASTTAPSSTTTRPATSTSCGSSGSSGTRSAASAT